MTPRFHSLAIRSVLPETADAITVEFDVPPPLRAAYCFRQGQFLTLRATIDGEELRRSYSICTSTQRYAERHELRIAIKRVAGGRFSNWANQHLRAGQSIDVMTPDGRFFTELSAAQAKHYVGFAGGSGITPMRSLIETTLVAEPASHFTLIYGNRTVGSIMFLEELQALKNRHVDRLALLNILSDEPGEFELFHGLLDQPRCAALLQGLAPAERIDHAFICGPEAMMNAAEAALRSAGVPAERISIERFGTPNPSGAPRPSDRAALPGDAPRAVVNVIIDGKTRRIDVPFDGPVILEAGLAAGLMLPYACKGGVCCTCRARVLDGQVRMDKNYTLEQHEIAAGFVLTCQSHPISAQLTVSYDDR